MSQSDPQSLLTPGPWVKTSAPELATGTAKDGMNQCLLWPPLPHPPTYYYRLMLEALARVFTGRLWVMFSASLYPLYSSSSMSPKMSQPGQGPHTSCVEWPVTILCPGESMDLSSWLPWILQHLTCFHVESTFSALFLSGLKWPCKSACPHPFVMNRQTEARVLWRTQPKSIMHARGCSRTEPIC